VTVNEKVLVHEFWNEASCGEALYLDGSNAAGTFDSWRPDIGWNRTSVTLPGSKTGPGTMCWRFASASEPTISLLPRPAHGCAALT
jgi:hypothetical protein